MRSRLRQLMRYSPRFRPPPPPVPSVADQLRQAIRGSGQSLYRIGYGSGVDPSLVSRFVAGKRGLSTKSVDKLAAYFGLGLGPIATMPDDDPELSDPAPMHHAGAIPC